MAVTPGHTAAPGRGAVFEPDPRRTVGYRICRAIFVTIVGLWFRPKVTGRANIPADGPVILAPVHRSFADFGFSAFVTRRKLFFMAKDGLWKNRFLGWFLLTLGAFPVHRESADREALAHAEEVLRRGQLLVLFPEGMRQEGPLVGELAEGAAFLAARTGAPIVPIGIGNSDVAMPKGQRIPKPLAHPHRRRRAAAAAGPDGRRPGLAQQGARDDRGAPRADPGRVRRLARRAAAIPPLPSATSAG